MPANSLITGRDIVIVGQQPWDTSIGSNCKNIAVEFAKHNRVLYVNSALDRISAIRNKEDDKISKRLNVINGKENGLITLDKNLWNLYPDVLIESANWIKIHSVFNILNKRNNRLFATSINKAIKSLGFKNFILFNDNDMFRSFYLKEFLKPKVSIYYSRDYMLGVDYWKYHGEKLEPRLIAKSDLCVANSTYLASFCKKYNPKSFYVGQGCDLELYTSHSKADIANDMKAFNQPVIGYVGALQSIRLDVELLVTIASARKDWTFVFVGPEDEVFKTSQLHHLSNVHFLGSRKPEELPSYINAFDVCLNPQIINEITIGNYPRKIDEYLAMGKPVVATKTEAMSIFEPYTYLATNADEYLQLIEKALLENNIQKEKERTYFAAQHTWENNVAEIYKAIKEVDNTF